MAQILDSLNDTSNFDGGFGGTTATSNGDGTVTLTRTQSGIDAGIDWRPLGGTGFLSLTGDQELTLTPVTGSNNALYNVNILYWATNISDPTNPVFVSEINWFSDTSSTSIQSVNVAQLAANNNVIGADEYYVRFRIDPFSFSGGSSNNPGFQFTQIQTTSSVPEPGTSLLLIVALVIYAVWKIGPKRAMSGFVSMP